MEFEIVKPLIGGTLIGLSSAILMLGAGRIAGISGILEGILRPKPNEFLWRVIFILGLCLGGFITSQFIPERFDLTTNRSFELIALAGLLVGVGALQLRPSLASLRFWFFYRLDSERS